MIDYENIKVTEYTDINKEEWDEFVESSKNGTFLHKIDYLHYHIDRFNYCSLLVKKENKLVAVIPGNIEGETFYSHKGLTYGGLIISPKTKIKDVITYFNCINEYLNKEKKIKEVIYKSIPYIYSGIPSEEDEYVLFRLGAKLKSCGASFTIDMDNRLPFSSLRKRGINKAKGDCLEMKRDYSYNDFWKVLTNNLEQAHKVKPVHTLSEILKLKNLFSENIQLFSVYDNNECLAGVVIYLSKNVAHLQYISATEKGKKVYALDLLFDYLINEVFSNIKYFDFGTSVENNGLYLNEGLAFQKQGFGARCVIYRQFVYEISSIRESKGSRCI